MSSFARVQALHTRRHALRPTWRTGPARTCGLARTATSSLAVGQAVDDPKATTRSQPPGPRPRGRLSHADAQSRPSGRTKRTPSRWRLRPPPPQAFRLALRLPRTTRRRGFNLEALRARCSTNLRHTAGAGKGVAGANLRKEQKDQPAGSSLTPPLHRDVPN
jgi:hypothetical protein